MRWLLALALAVVGCSGSHKSPVDAQLDAPPDAAIYTGPCMMVFSGQPNLGTFQCTTTTAWTASTDHSTFSIDPIQFPPGLQWQGGMSTSGMLGETTYGGTAGAATIQELASMMTHQWNTYEGQGTFSLTFTSVGGAMPTTDGETYTVHGHLEANLVGPSTILLNARF